MSTSARAAIAAACWIGFLAPVAGRADAPPAVEASGDPLPAGAVARLGSARLRHVANSLAWAPDGKTFATAGTDGLVRIWDTDDGKEVRAFKTSMFNSFNSIAYLPDGKSLAAAGADGAIHLWDLTTGREVRTLASAPQTGLLLANARLAPGPDEGTVAAIGRDNVCRVLDLTTGKAVREIEAMQNVRFGQTALSADGRRFAAWASAPAADTLTVWDLADGKELFHAPTALKQISGIVFAPDGKTVAVYSSFQPLVLVTWDVDTGKELRRYDMGQIVLPVFSPNGKYLAGQAGDHFIHLWGLASGKDLRQFDTSLWNGAFGTGGAAFSPDGKKLAACLGASLRVWDVETGQELREFTGHVSAVSDLRFTPDGRRLLSCGRDGTARLWDAASGAQRSVWNGAQGGVLEMAASADGAFVAAPSGTNLIRADLSGEKPVEKTILTLPVGVFFSNPVLSPDGKTLASLGQDRVLRLWDLTTAKETSRPWPEPGAGAGVLTFSPDGRTLALAGFNAPVDLWDVPAGKELRQLDAAAGTTPVPAPPGPIGRPFTGQFRGATHLAFLPDGRSLMCITASEASLWETASGRDRMRIARPNGNLTRVAVSPDGRLAAVGTQSGTVVVLDAENGNDLGERGEARGGAVTALAFAPDGKTLAVGSTDGAIVIWDVKEWAGRPRPAAADLKPEKLSALWKDLIDADAGRAYKAVRTLAAAPAASAPFLKERLTEVVGDDKRIAQLIVDLNDDQFDVREKAEAELLQLGDAAVPALRKALESNPPPETRRRALEVLDKHKGGAVTEEVRSVRALEALERSGAPEATEALRALAKDAPNAVVQQEAAAALARLERQRGGP